MFRRYQRHCPENAFFPYFHHSINSCCWDMPSISVPRIAVISSFSAAALWQWLALMNKTWANFMCVISVWLKTAFTLQRMKRQWPQQSRKSSAQVANPSSGWTSELPIGAECPHIWKLTWESLHEREVTCRSLNNNIMIEFLPMSTPAFSSISRRAGITWMVSLWLEGTDQIKLDPQYFFYFLAMHKYYHFIHSSF